MTNEVNHAEYAIDRRLTLQDKEAEKNVTVIRKSKKTMLQALNPGWLPVRNNHKLH